MVVFPGLDAWQTPAAWPRIRTVDMHTAGEPLRIITGGFPNVPGSSILERRQYVEDHLDHLRRRLMWEPRGHRDMYGCLITAPVTAGASFGVIFMHGEGYSTMCGHGIIAVSKIAVETGLVTATGPETHLVIDTPAGIVESWVRLRDGVADAVRFRNVPSYVLCNDESINVPGYGNVRYDIAFGGAYYAFVDAEAIGLQLVPSEADAIVRAGMAIKRAVMESRPIEHPIERDLGFLYGTIFVGPAQTKGVHSRNVCVFAEGQIDRSPTGTGVSGRLALHFRKGEIRLNQTIVIESILGSRFACSVVGQTSFGGCDAVLPEVEGTAAVTGRSEFVFDPNDPWADGFLMA